MITTKSRILVVWEGRDGESERQQIKFSYSLDQGESWSRWKNVQTTSAHQSRPTIVIAPSGRIYLFMYSTVEGKASVFYSQSDDEGDNWSNWDKISTEELDARHVSVVSNKAGEVLIAYRSGSNTTAANIYFSLLKNGTWSSPKQVSKSTKYQFFPNVSTDINNNFFVSWQETSQSAGFPKEEPDSTELFVKRLSGDDFVDKKKIAQQVSSFSVLPTSLNPRVVFTAYIRKDQLFFVSENFAE